MSLSLGTHGYLERKDRVKSSPGLLADSLWQKEESNLPLFPETPQETSSFHHLSGVSAGTGSCLPSREQKLK